MTTFDTDTRVKRSGRHPINIGHFVMGIAFVGIVVIWILIESDAVTGDDIRWLLPVPWVLAGVAGLLATTRRKHADWETYESGQRGWVGGQDEQRAPVEDTPVSDSHYDDLDEKLARAERENGNAAPTTTMAAPPEPAEPTEPTEPGDPTDPADPTDSADPADPADPEDPADPVDPADTEENDR